MMTPSACARASGEDGFAFAELLVGAVLTLVVFGAAAGFVSTHLVIARTQADAADLQQRARATADVLSTELSTAGAWADHGGQARGLVCCVPVVHPRRLGTRSADPPGTARADTVTLVRALPHAVPGRLRDPLGGVLTVELTGGCVSTRPVCGLREDDGLLVFDEVGRHDFLLLGAPAVDLAPVTPRQSGAPHAFAAGANVIGVQTFTYYFDAAARQLRHYDGHLSDVPIIDDVVAMMFEYSGSAGVPPKARAEAGTETCWFDAAGLPRFGRSETPVGTPDVRLDLAEFRDGPWCGAGDNRFDADLLRIRHVRVIVRLAAGAEMARGTGARFLRTGRATSAHRLVPDVEVIVDVAPRTLNGDY
jgi:hypothetical protein